MTFLPEPDFRLSAQCLDRKRLGSQRLEAKILFRVLNNEIVAPQSKIVKMWKGYENALALYHDLVIEEWVSRGYANNMPFMKPEGEIIFPPWFGDIKVHSSHRAALLMKDFDWYSKFGWKELPEIKYYWPVP